MRHPFSRFAIKDCSAWRRLSWVVVALLAFSWTGGAHAGESAAPLKIAVFEFELDDHSAGAGVVSEDDNDRANLRQSTDEAKRLLVATGRYSIVDTASVAADVKAQSGVIDCDSCEVALAKKLGADQALAGVITRVSRTEYTLFMRVGDAHTGAKIATAFTGLRLGANYAWARGVTWLMKNQVLPKLVGASVQK